MKYFTYCNNIDYAKFIIEDIPEIEMASVSFDDDNYKEFLAIVAENNQEITQENIENCYFHCVGDDGYLYGFRLTDFIRKKIKRISLKKYNEQIGKQKNMQNIWQIAKEN